MISGTIIEPLEARTLLSTTAVRIMPLGDSITEAFAGHASYRYWLWKQLQSVPGIHAFSSAANFFFARCECAATLDRLIESLIEQRILIRDCRGTEGLDGAYFRFAIRTRPENSRLLEHLREL